MKKSKNRAIIFDIDGVLIDVSESYRVAIKKTAEFFLGRILNMEDVEAVENKANDDYDAAELLIRENGGEFRKDVIIKKFQEYYLGRNFDGLVKNEKSLIKEDALRKLKKYKLAIFTERPKIEARYALKRFGINKHFEVVIAKENVKEGKPNPEGLLKVIKKLKVKHDEVVYVGSNLAGLMAAKNADVNFIGVCQNANKTYLKNLLKSEGAKIVLDSVNELVKVIKYWGFK